MSITAMRQALEALYMANAREWPENKIGAAINALSAAIEQAEKQEPVAWLYRDAWGTLKLSQIMPPPVGAFPVYTTPPAAQSCPYIRSTAEGTHHCALAQRPWVGLTDAEIEEWDYDVRDVVMDIEKLLREKNT